MVSSAHCSTIQKLLPWPPRHSALSCHRRRSVQRDAEGGEHEKPLCLWWDSHAAPSHTSPGYDVPAETGVGGETHVPVPPHDTHVVWGCCLFLLPISPRLFSEQKGFETSPCARRVEGTVQL